jgi:hypothetical protein
VPLSTGERPAPLTLQPAAPVGWHLTPQPPPDVTPGPAAAPAVAPQPVVGQIAVAMARANEHRLEIRLDPPELGRVQIHLTPVDGGVQAVVLADRPETQDLLRRHAGSLEQELCDAGFGTVSLDFTAGHQATPDTPELPQPTFEPTTTPPPPPTTPVPPSRPATAAGTLDVRL